MYEYGWDAETGGLLLTNNQAKLSKEPRPVYYRELDILGFDQYWNYPKDDRAPLMWAEANNYIYRGRLVASTKGGSLYTKPELVLIEEPEPDAAPLRFVDIDAMCRKNHELMETLVQETVKKAYNAYRRYRNKVDIVHVSFSGGKDSVVTLDVVARAIPHSNFVVIFGDTGMEFPDTYDAVARTMDDRKYSDIDFYTAKSPVPVIQMWETFGPPSKTIRWCCSVHKTTPQLLKLREITGKNDLREMSFVGVRAEESVRRSDYDYVSLGKKHKGQYSCNPILNWTSAEVYLHIYENRLILNDAYKKGNSRAGCLVCPMAGERPEYMRRSCYPEEVEKFVQVIRDTDARAFPTQNDTERFIDSGGWKARNNGRDILTLPDKYMERDETTIEVISPSQNWAEWMKALGEFSYDGSTCILNYRDYTVNFSIQPKENGYIITLPDTLIKKQSTLARYIKQTFRKAAYCIGCGECQADCPYGCLSFVNNQVDIADKCRHCLNCHKADEGCLLYKSLVKPKGIGAMNTKEKSIDCYADHAPKYDWIQSFFALKDDFWEENNLGSVMLPMFKRFLRDAGLLENNKLTKFAYQLDAIGIDKAEFWGILLVNLSYSPEIGWYVKRVPFDEEISKERLIDMLRNFKEVNYKEMTERGAKSVSGAYRRILALPFGDVLGLGRVVKDGKTFYIRRDHWRDPIPEVILYGLYKFAEACGDYYQFTLETLLDDSIERDGVSPTRIFGLDRKTMVRILNGLTSSYPDFISASFTLDLYNITLRENKKPEDVLELFKGGAWE